MADALRKQLRIKTGVVKRLLKEKSSYEAEANTLEGKLGELKASGGDPYQVRKSEEVLAESRAMVPDTLRRLGAAVPDLNAVLEQAGGDASLTDSEELTAAKDIIAQAQTVLAQ